MVTHVTLHGVLHILHNVTSGTKGRDSFILSFLLPIAPDSAGRSTVKNGALVEVELSHDTLPL